MTDNLRDRIAAVIDGVWQSGYPDAPADALADAVIAALRLHRDDEEEMTDNFNEVQPPKDFKWTRWHGQ